VHTVQSVLLLPAGVCRSTIDPCKQRETHLLSKSAEVVLQLPLCNVEGHLCVFWGVSAGLRGRMR